MKLWKVKIIWIWVVGLFLLPSNLAIAGPFELSIGFSFYRTNYSPDSFTWTRRWGTSIGYDLTELTEVEFSWQAVTNRTKITGSQDTTFYDNIYSLNVVQGILAKNVPVQPYVKLGIGQLNRDTSGEYADGSTPPTQIDSITGVLGLGMRIFLKRNFAIRLEATTYMTGASIRTWKDNVSTSIGGSILF